MSGSSGRPRPALRVDTYSRAGGRAPSIDVAGSVCRIAARPGRRGVSVDVHVPRRMSIDVRVEAGSIDAHLGGDDAKLVTGAGGIRLHAPSERFDALRIETGVGPVEVDVGEVMQTGEVQTECGPIHVRVRRSLPERGLTIESEIGGSTRDPAHERNGVPRGEDRSWPHHRRARSAGGPTRLARGGRSSMGRRTSMARGAPRAPASVRSRSRVVPGWPHATDRHASARHERRTPRRLRRNASTCSPKISATSGATCISRRASEIAIFCS